MLHGLYRELLIATQSNSIVEIRPNGQKKLAHILTSSLAVVFAGGHQLAAQAITAEEYDGSIEESMTHKKDLYNIYASY